MTVSPRLNEVVHQREREGGWQQYGDEYFGWWMDLKQWWQLCDLQPNDVKPLKSHNRGSQ